MFRICGRKARSNADRADQAGLWGGVLDPAGTCDNRGVTEQPPERPARYQRSTNGLIGAMVVTLLAIGAFVAFRALNRDELEIRPEPVDYLTVVEQAQRAGRRPAYPPALPEGWIATSARVTEAESPLWGLGLLTTEGEFAGVRQSASSVSSLVESYVDPKAVEGPAVSLPDALVSSWRTYTDDGGDRAYVAELDGEVLLVYGTASESDLETLIGSLTTDPVRGS